MDADWFSSCRDDSEIKTISIDTSYRTCHKSKERGTIRLNRLIHCCSLYTVSPPKLMLMILFNDRTASFIAGVQSHHADTSMDSL